ncbi:MBG domain-containing protein, partial [Algoriphagus zhangzhouensis]
MDRITNYALGIVLFFLFFISPSFSQTIDFESLSNYQGLGLSYSEGGFTFSINDPGNDKQIIARTGVGYESSKSLYDNNLAVGAINTWTIIKNDGTEFQFKNIYLQDAGFASTSGTIQGFKNGSAVTAKKSINFNGYKDYSSDADFFDVDEIRIEALDINFYLDQFVYGPVPPPNTPPTASSFTAANGPYENLTYTFSTSMFGYSDIDGDPLSHILIESLPASGVLFLDINDNNVVNSGEEVAVNQQIGKAGLDGGRLKYIQNGSTNTSFQFEVNDGTVNSSGNYVASLNGSPVPTVTLSLTPTSKSESLLTNSLIRATLSNVYGAPVTVNLGFSGAATGSGVDYSVSGTSITINPGNTTGTVILSNVPDALYEGNETVIIDITSVTNGVENGVQQQTFTIIDDDPVPTVSLEVLGIYNPITDESGGQAYVRAKLDAIAGTTVTVPLSFSGTASGGGTDYSVTGTTITLSSGETMDSIRVTSQYDGIEEGDETIIIDMGTPTNGIKGTPDQVTLTIKDEDLEAPKDYTVEINQDPITPSNSSNVSFSFTNAEIGSTYNYLFTSSAGGSSVSGSGTISSTDQTISNIDLSGMSDGTITLSVDLTDSFNNTGATVDDTADKLASAPPFLTGVPTDITVNEGVASNIDLSGTTFGDPDAAADDVLSISYLSLGGTLSFSPGVGVTISQPIPGAWTTSGTISNLNTYLSDPTSIKYTSNPGVIGDNAGSIGLSGSDGLVGASFGTINIDVEPAPYIGYISVPANGTYIAGNNLDFLVNFSEAVTISGSPEITLVIGGNIRAASYVSGSGSTSLFFRYTVATGDLDTDGVEVTEVYLNGGTIQNSSGINANLTLNNVGSTSGVLVDAVAPFGYNVAFDLLGEILINPINVTIIEFRGTGLEVGTTLHYSFTSSGGGTPVTGTESVVTTAQTFDNGGAGYDLSGLTDGTITLTIYLVDAAGNQGSNVSDTETKDTGAPSGYSVAWNDALINAIEASNTSFTVSNAEVGATVFYSISSAGDGNTATVSGSKAVVNSSQVVNVDVSSLVDGSLTVVVYLQDGVGNVGVNETDNSTVLDQTNPVSSIPDLTPASDTGLSDSDNITSDDTPELTGNTESNATVTIYADAAELGSTTSDGAGNWTFTPASAIAEGTYDITAIATDLAGNTGSASGALTVTIDMMAPNPPDPIGVTEDTGLSNTDYITSDNTLIFYGTSEPNSIVTIAVTGSTGPFTTTTDGSGNWLYDNTANSLSEGLHELYAYSTDLAGNVGAVSYVLEIIIDTQAPPAPSTPDLAPGSDSGVSDSDNITNDLTPTFTGTALPGSAVTVISNVDGALGVTTANGSGNWTFTAGSNVSTGVHVIRATQADLAGNNSTVSSGLSVTFDVNPPFLNLEGRHTTYLNANGITPQVKVGDLLLSGMFDDYTPSSLIKTSLSKSVFNCSDIGANPVDVIATDLAGNSFTQSVIIRVVDNIKPTILAKSTITLNVDAFGIVDLTAGMVDEGSFDNCSILSQVLSKTLFDKTDEGSNTVKYTVTDVNGNSSEVDIEVIIVVVPKILNVTVDLGQTKIYGDADPIFTYTATGFEAGDDVGSIMTGALSRDPGKDVGTYSITLGTLDAGPNYTINFTGADFEITPATLNVFTFNYSKVYGDADPTFSFAASGLKNGDPGSIITGALVRVAGEDVGTYAINQGTLDAGSNYTINFTSRNLVITPATLNVTANAGQSKVYGDTDPVFTFQYSGLKNGDTDVVITGSLARASGEDVGMYPINVGTLDAGPNYTVNFTSADFEVTPATLDITADAGQSKVYGDTDPVFTYQYSGLKNGDTDAVFTGELQRASGEDIGTYPINQGTLDAGSNYTINYTGADFTIGEKILTVTVDGGQSKIYGDADPVFTFVADGFEGGDDLSILTGTLSRATGEDVGTYPITLGTLDAGPNYTINFLGSDFEITQATLDITADAGQSKIYGDADPEFTFVADGFEGGDDETILTGALTRAAGEDVGTYAINLGTLDAGPNYTINFTSADFEITPATLDITADGGQSKVYGDADPVFT